MTLHELVANDGDRSFTIGRSKIVWDTGVYNRNGNLIISRVIGAKEKGGKPFLMGLKYKSRRANPDSIVTLL